MGDYILRSKAIEEFINCISLVPPSYVIKILQEIPDADVVSGGVYRQIALERDLAIQQLYELGLKDGREK